MTEEVAFHEDFQVKGGDFQHAGEASVEVKTLLKELGLDADIVRRAAIVCYEAEMNVIMYADRGRLELTVTPRLIRVIVEDKGPGIKDIQQAMVEGYSTATPEMRELGFGAGLGLSNIKKNTDVFRITSRVGRGTRLEMTIRTKGRRP